MRAVALLAAAFVAASCAGGGDDAAPATTASAARTPSAATLVTDSLTRAREARSVHFTLRVELGMKAGGRSFSYELTAEGDRSDEGLRATGRSDGEPYRVVEVGNRLFLEWDGTWYRVPTTFRRILSSESFADLVPQDLGRSLRSGELGRLLTGVVEDGGDVWVLRGTVESQALTNLLGRATDSFVPYEREGEARYVVGKDDLLPRSFSYSYRLDRAAIGEHLQEGEAPEGLEERSGLVDLTLSDWREDVALDAPEDARPAPRALLSRIFDGLLSFFGSYL